MAILITGITGFVGKYLTRYLLENNSSIKIFGTYLTDEEYQNNGIEGKNVKLLKCNIVSDLEVGGAIKEVKPDQIYHLAAMSSGNEQDRDKVFKVNCDGTINIIRSCQDLNKKVRILLASTSYIYGSSDDCQPFDEKDEEKPVGIYAESKLEMERRAKEYLSDHIEIIISRAFNHTGPGQIDNFVVPAFAKQIAEIEKSVMEPVLKVGNLEAIRDFLDVRDVIRAYYMLMKSSRSGEIYNVASGTKYKIRDVLDILLSLSTKKIKVEKDPERMRPSDIACSEGSYKKIKKELGWEPKFDFKDIIKLTLDYWRDKI